MNATTLTPNVDLLRLTLRHILMHPGQWRQTAWRTQMDCGTAYCFAGWAILLHGGRFLRDHTGKTSELLVVPKAGEHLGAPVLSAPAYARHILGLTWEQAHRLFHELNTLDGLRLVVSEICDGTEGGGA